MHLWKSSLTFASLALVCACSGETSAPEATATTEASIIGGVALDSTALDAVGSLVTIYRYSGGQVSYSSPFCTGTLISKRQVLSAEHCVRDSGRGQEYGFAIGADGRRPRKVIPVAVVDIEQSVTGGYLGLGSDVAVLHLGEPVEDVTPFAVGQLTADDVGRRFVGVGYGSQDTQGTSGTRRGGSMTFGGTGGRLFERSFGSFENFLGAVPSIEDLRWEVGDVTTELGKQRAREVYDRRVLLDEHEGFFGYREGDAQACHGDSGGPIFRVVDGKRTVFGVTSWGTHRFGAFCDFGGVYAVLSPTVYAFVEKSLAWVDPCDGLPQAGRCEGTVAVRCSTLREGVRRRLATECADLGLVCGAGADGQVNCQ